ncbi:MAG: hypothetical protein EXR20_09155 [Bacteroidetes bacterium]|nr:hypothetical protein [Bacteroidota bacterium]
MNHETNQTTKQSANAITLMIIDESGSMMNLKKATEESHLGILQKIKSECAEMPNLNQFVNTWVFDSHRIEEIQTLTKIQADDTLKPIDLRPNGSTPLFDAIGKACSQLEIIMSNLKFQPEDTMVTVAVFTDGEENSSRIFTQGEVKRLVTRLKTQGWSFNYYGTDTSVEEMKERLAFDGGMVMEKSNSGFRAGMLNFSMSSSKMKTDWLKDWMKEDFTE